MLIVGPEIPETIRPFAMSVVEAIRALQNAGSPAPVFACTKVDLPPATEWPSCILRISDLDILAVSNGAAWIRQDTGAAI